MIPIVFNTKQRVTFSDLDPYNHVRTAAYSRYYVDHRMNGLRENVGGAYQSIQKESWRASGIGYFQNDV